jgi:hypothetical protein
VNSSPFHKILDSNSASGAASDDVPNHMDEPDYYVGGEKLGKLQFNLSYDFQESTLTLRIIRAVDLPAKDFSGTSDPYVKILLLPDKKSKLTTNIKRRNLNPRWNEVFAFEGACAFLIQLHRKPGSACGGLSASLFLHATDRSASAPLLMNRLVRPILNCPPYVITECLIRSDDTLHSLLQP